MKEKKPKLLRIAHKKGVTEASEKDVLKNTKENLEYLVKEIEKNLKKTKQSK